MCGRVFIENGLRKVTPYYSESRVHCKGRWFKRTVLDVLTSEFKFYPQQYITRTAAADGIRLRKVQKGNQITCGTGVLSESIGAGDILEFRGHGHEPPIPYFGDKFDIIHEDDEVLVINKPAGLPSHPSGKYQKNSATDILRQQRGEPFYPSHRLDRLTSGVLILAKSTESIKKLHRRQRNEPVFKEYYAKVEGNFSNAPLECAVPLLNFDKNLPFAVLRRSILAGGLKHSITRFRMIGFNGTHSLVACYPVTGRTHQIRKHLAILGYPIANDKLYLDPEFRQFSIALSELNFDSESDWTRLCETFEKLSIDFRKELPSRLTGHYCSECGGALYGDPELEEREIWLHSRVYASATGDHASYWRYEAALPLWAQNF